MAWMPVAEAAAALGVSERTIWRRIKAQSIESRSEAGRTLVVVEDDATRQDAVRHLSHVAAAQLSMRKLDADTVTDVLAVLADYRSAFDLEIARTRRASRFAFALAAVLMLGLSVGVWYHMDRLGDARLTHADAMRALRDDHADQLNAERAHVAELTAGVAQATGLAEARAEAVEDLRAIADRQQNQLADAESSREMLQCTLDERLADLNLLVESQSATADALEAEKKRLAEALAAAQSDRAREQAVRDAVARQSERVTQAIRASAARHAGTAEGLQLHVAWQQQAIEDLRRELTEARTVIEHSPEAQERLADLNQRRRMWQSLISTPKQTAADDAGSTAAAADDADRAPVFDAERADARGDTGDADVRGRATGKSLAPLSASAQSTWWNVVQHWAAAWWGTPNQESTWGAPDQESTTQEESLAQAQ